MSNSNYMRVEPPKHRHKRTVSTTTTSGSMETTISWFCKVCYKPMKPPKDWGKLTTGNDLVVDDPETNTVPLKSAKDTNSDNLRAQIEELLGGLTGQPANEEQDEQFHQATHSLLNIISKAVIEGRLDEVKQVDKLLESLHQGTPGAGWVHYGEMGESLDARIAELSAGADAVSAHLTDKEGDK